MLRWYKYIYISFPGSPNESVWLLLLRLLAAVLDSMEGYLMIPPDRGTIIGRAVWKVRLDYMWFVMCPPWPWLCYTYECAELMNWLSIQSRYVVVGNPRQEDKDQSGLSLSQVLSPGRMREMREGGNRLREGSNRLKDGGNSRSSKPQPKPQPKIDPEGTYLSIYKTKVKKKKANIQHWWSSCQGDFLLIPLLLLPPPLLS